MLWLDSVSVFGGKVVSSGAAGSGRGGGEGLQAAATAACVRSDSVSVSRTVRTMSAQAQMRAMLDQLMGTGRDGEHILDVDK